MELIAVPEQAENTQISIICKSLDQKVICHCYAYFDIEEEKHKALVLLTEWSLLFYFDSGENYITALPFEVLKIYPVQDGILLERAEGKDLGCKVFTLFHPNENVKPVMVNEKEEHFDIGSVLLVRGGILVAGKGGIKIYRIHSSPAENAVDIELKDNGLIFEEVESKSSMKLQLVATLSCDSYCNDLVWINRDSSSTEILWILSKQSASLEGYRFEIASIEKLYSYTVQDACEFVCPISSGILCLFFDGTVKMWIGYTELIPCDINLTQLQSKLRPKRSLSASKGNFDRRSKSLKAMRVIGLENSKEEGFVVLNLSDETSTLARANLTFHSNLISSCLDQIAYVVSADEFVRFYSRLLFTTFGEINNEEKLNYWDSFVVTFLSFLKDNVDPSSKISLDDTFDDDDFKWLNSNQNFLWLPKSIASNLKIKANGKSIGSLLSISEIVHRRFHTEPSFLQHINELVITFHLIYQDLLLDVSLKSQLKQLGDFLSQILNSTQYQAYYRGLGHFVDPQFSNLDLNLKISDLPTITDWIYTSIAKLSPAEPITSVLNSIGRRKISSHKGLDLLKTVSSLFNILLEDGPHKMIQYISGREFNINLDHLPVAIALPLRQAIYQCRISPGFLATDGAACTMIGRKDLANNATNYSYFDKEERAKIVKLRFGKDDRIDQVTELLNPVADTVIEVQLKANMSIEEVSAAQQAALEEWAIRPFAFALGNALFNFESSVIVPTEVFLIPKLKKSARLSPMNSLIELSSNPQNDVFVDWPEFHTGVAAALKIRADCQDVNSSWIVFNQIKSAEGTKVDTSHAGFIYGLGLLGHLKKLDSSDSLRNYFLPQHEILSVGHLLGLAAAHVGSRHPQITNMLSVHLPSMLPNQSIELNTGYVLKTGAMIGYGLLHFSHPSQYKFDKVFSEIDQLEITDNSTENSGNGSYLIGCGFSLGFIGLGSVGNFKSSARLIEKLVQKLKSPKSSCEAISLTSAIGLICLKSNSQIALDALAIPSNEFLLDWIAPEALMVRVICRCLVMWNCIEPTKEWVNSQIPTFLFDSVKPRPMNLSPRNEHQVHSYYSIVGGICFAMGLKYASTCDPQVLKLIEEYYDEITPLCNLKSNQFSYAEKLFAVVARNALNATMSALCLVLAGSGNIDYFQKLKPIHEKTSVEILYGSHMAASMSIGLLFLASGSATIGTSNKAIATLFCSFFPLYPSSPTDNRFHLQALRHMWVLAIERRCVITRDVETNDIVTVPIEIRANQDHEKLRTLYSPAILPPFDHIKSIKILGPRYWELDLVFDDIRDQDRNVTIWVQRKSQHLSYSDDPDGKRGIMAASFPKFSAAIGADQERLSKLRERFIQSFSSKPKVLAFVRYLCMAEKDNFEENKMSVFCMQILYECLCNDKMEMVSIYVSLFHELKRALSGYVPTSMDAISMRIIIEFVKKCQLADEECIMNPTFTDWLHHDITDAWNQRFRKLLPLCAEKYLDSGSLPPKLSLDDFQAFMAFLAFFQWPKPQDLGALKQNAHLIDIHSPLKSAFLLRRFFPLVPTSALRQILQIAVSSK